MELETMLTTRKIHFSYGKFQAIEGVDLSIPKGKIYGFLGKNGAGKTTLIRILTGIFQAKSGEIEFLGKKIKKIDTSEKQEIGYVPQEQTFYPWMTGAQLGKFVGGMYSKWDSQEFYRLLHIFDIPEDRKTSALSGGMKAKLALALALAHSPSLLILDEPSAGLDPVARREFLDIISLQAKRHEKTIFFSSHLVNEVEEVADYIGILSHGRLRFEGEIQHLQQSVRRGFSSFDLPKSFQLLREEQDGARIYYGKPREWQEFGLQNRVEELSLEEIFLAFATEEVSQL